MPFAACCTPTHHLATPSAPEVICAGPPAQPPPIAPDFSPTEPYACRRSMAQLHWCMGRGLVTCRGRAARPIQAPWAQLPPRDPSTTSSSLSSRCALPARACTVPSCTRPLPAPAVLEPLTPASCAGADVDRWGRLHAGLCERLCVTLCLRIFVFIIICMVTCRLGLFPVEGVHGGYYHILK